MMQRQTEYGEEIDTGIHQHFVFQFIELRFVRPRVDDDDISILLLYSIVCHWLRGVWFIDYKYMHNYLRSD